MVEDKDIWIDYENRIDDLISNKNISLDEVAERCRFLIKE